VTGRDPEAQQERGSLGLGLALGAAFNLVVGSGALWFAAVMLLGIGMSSNPEVDRSVLGCIWLVVIGGPLILNSVGLGLATLHRRWAFLKGWLWGLLIGTVAVAAQVAIIAALVLLAAWSEH
jgi:hypothetical protein